MKMFSKQYSKTKPLTCKEVTSSSRSSGLWRRQRRLGLISATGIDSLF